MKTKTVLAFLIVSQRHLSGDAEDRTVDDDDAGQGALPRQDGPLARQRAA